MEVIEKENIQAVPSYPPACEVSDVVASDYIYDSRKSAFEVCIPAIVVEYERDKNIVKVTPAVNEKTSTDKYIKRAEIKVPVFSFAGGGFMINFPLKKGDTGWLLSCDRDISLFKQQLTAINPNTERTHCIEDSFFFPDKVNKFNLDDDDKTNFVLQSLTRNLKMTFSGDTVKIFAGQPKKDGEKDNKKSSSSSKESNSSTQGSNSSESQKTQETYITLTSDKIDIHSGHGEKRGEKSSSSSQKKQETDISLTADTIKIYSTSGSGGEGEKKESTVTLKQDQISIVTTDKLIAESKSAKVTVKETLEAKSKNANITVEENLTAKCKNGDVKADSNINISASNVHIKGQVSIDGQLSVSGSTSIGSSLSVSSSISASGDVTGAGKSLSGHTHQGVHGPTGGPQ